MAAGSSATADFEDALTGHTSQQAFLGLIETLRTPDPPVIAEKVAMVALVGIGIGVPPRLARPSGLVDAGRSSGYGIGRCRLRNRLRTGVLRLARPTLN